jgi:hypothetical protein
MLHKKQMLELRAEEAKVEEMFARARQMVVQVETQGLASSSPAPPIVSIISAGPMDSEMVGRSPIPNTLQQLDSLFVGISEGLQLQLNNIRLRGYEELIKQRLDQFDQKVNEASANNTTHRDRESAKRREKLNCKLSESIEHVQHYCHLVFWTLCKAHLTPQKLQAMLGSAFNLEHHTVNRSTQYVTWSNLDEKKFGLPVDLGNVPKAVMDSGMWNAGDWVRVREMARKWVDCQCEKVYTKQQRRVWLWRFKALVAETLCKEAQKEILASIR